MSTLPASIGNWSDVEIFSVAKNKLTGSLPGDIATWSRLSYFDVSGNQLTGTLPNGIGQCTALETVCTLTRKLQSVALESRMMLPY